MLVLKFCPKPHSRRQVLETVPKYIYDDNNIIDIDNESGGEVLRDSDDTNPNGQSRKLNIYE